MNKINTNNIILVGLKLYELYNNKTNIHLKRWLSLQIAIDPNVLKCNLNVTYILREKNCCKTYTAVNIYDVIKIAITYP